MNIVTPMPTSIVFNTANVNTESARRDNVLRETIPQTSNAENSEAKSGLGSESDKLRTPGLASPLVYERPQPTQNGGSVGLGSEGSPDNANEESAGKENAEDRQREEQELAEQREIQQLEKRDREVRAHEQAHAAVGGQYAGSPSYDYETGPNGRRYAVGGEVSIDLGDEASPEQTVRKMQQVKAAALAPAEPSPQDLRVATEATQKAVEARAQINQRSNEEIGASSSVPELDEIVDGINIDVPKRSLDESFGRTDFTSEQATLAEPRQQNETMMRRINVIQNTYQNISMPQREGLSLTA